jgi:diaminopimelate decarboxylase
MTTLHTDNTTTMITLVGGFINVIDRLTTKLQACVQTKMKLFDSPSGPTMACPRLFMENGRYITGPYGWLVTRCHVIKSAFDTKFYGVDACMSNLMRPGMYEAYHHITVPVRHASVRPDAKVPTEKGTSHLHSTLSLSYPSFTSMLFLIF